MGKILQSLRKFANRRVGQTWDGGLTTLPLAVLFFCISCGTSTAHTAAGPGEMNLSKNIYWTQIQKPASQFDVAQNERVTNAPPNPDHASGEKPGNAEDAPKAYVTFKTPYEFFLCGITVALGIFMVGLLVIMCWRSGPTEEFLRTFIVTTVIFAALFLIVAGYTEKQTAPVFGILGTVLGYVFGKAASPSTARTRTNVTTPQA